MPEHSRFLVIGCGSIGQRHIGNLQALGVKDILAFDVRADRRARVEARFSIPTLDTLEEGWRGGPNVAFITVPTSLHIPLALEAAKHDCHLFIEKPLSNSLEYVDELLSLVQANGLVTLVGCNMRFHPGLALVRRLISEGAVGKVVSARVQVGQWLPDWHPEEDYRQSYSARQELGGGTILDAIHELDYIHWLVESDIRQVACFTGKLSRLEIDTEDTAAILLRFASGAIGEVHLDYIQRAYSRSCHIIGEEGTIHWDYTGQQVRWYSAADRRWHTCPDPAGWEANQMYLDEMRHFLRCLDGGEQPALDVMGGKQVLDIALAAKRSAETGQVVKLREQCRQGVQ